MHENVAQFYNWFDISKRTEIVYGLVKKEAHKNLGEHLATYIRSGVLAYLLVVSLCYIILQFLEIFVPRKYIDIAKTYTEMNVVPAQGEGEEDWTLLPHRDCVQTIYSKFNDILR